MKKSLILIIALLILSVSVSAYAPQNVSFGATGSTASLAGTTFLGNTITTGAVDMNITGLSATQQHCTQAGQNITIRSASGGNLYNFQGTSTWTKLSFKLNKSTTYQIGCVGSNSGLLNYAYGVVSAPVSFINISNGLLLTGTGTVGGCSGFPCEAITMEFTSSMNNTIIIYPFEETTGNPITQPINITAVGQNLGTLFINQTSQNFTLLSGAPSDTYVVTFSSQNYSTRQYSITLNSTGVSFLNAYLIPGTASTTSFIVLDQATSQPISSSFISQETPINGVWTLVGSSLSGIDGTSTVYYRVNTPYRFYVTKTGYMLPNSPFYINPISQSTYYIRMTANSTTIPASDLNGVSIYFNPQIFRQYNASNQTFLVSLSSPQGYLSSYRFNLTYNNTALISGSGTNAIGQSFTNPVNVSGIRVNENLVLNVIYTTQNGGTNTYQYILSIGNFTGTLIGNKDNVFNLSLFDRLIIATLLLVLLGGVAFFFGGFEAGGVMVVFIFGYLTAVGLLNIYIGAVAIIISFIVLVWRAQI